MSYDYRVTLRGVSRHRADSRKRLRLEIEHIATGRYWERWLGPWQRLLYTLLLEGMPPLEAPLVSDASLVVGSLSHRVLLYDHGPPERGGVDTYALGYLEIGDSFLLWTEEAASPPREIAAGPAPGEAP